MPQIRCLGSCPACAGAVGPIAFIVNRLYARRLWLDFQRAYVRRYGR